MADEPVDELKERLKIDFRNEWRVFAWCFIIASLLWGLNSLGDNYTRRIKVQAYYSSLPAKKVYVKPLPRTFSVQVTGKGWDLLGVLLRGAEEVNLDLSSFEGPLLMTNKDLKNEIRSQFPSRLSIQTIEPEMVDLRMEEKMTRRVPVVLHIKAQYDRHYGLGAPIRYSPRFVTVSGPRSIVQGIRHIRTIDTSFFHLHKEAEHSVRLEKPGLHNLTYNVQKVRVKLPVYQLTEDRHEVPVEVIKKKFKRRVQLIPERVTVIYQTPLNRYRKVDESLFEAVIDGGEIDTSGKGRPLKVKLINHPDFTYNFRLQPDYIQYVIQKQ